MSDISELKELLEIAIINLKGEVDNSKEQINLLIEENRKLRSTVDVLSRKVEKKNSSKLKDEVVRKFRRHKREMIKHKIVDTVRLRRISLPELKEIIVDEMGYCSKATFYRYYNELRNEGTVTVNNNIVTSNVLNIV